MRLAPRCPHWNKHTRTGSTLTRACAHTHIHTLANTIHTHTHTHTHVHTHTHTHTHTYTHTHTHTHTPEQEIHQSPKRFWLTSFCFFLYLFPNTKAKTTSQSGRAVHAPPNNQPTAINNEQQHTKTQHSTQHHTPGDAGESETVEG